MLKKLAKLFQSFSSPMLMLPENKGKTMAIAERVRVLRDYLILVVMMILVAVVVMLTILGAVVVNF